MTFQMLIFEVISVHIEGLRKSSGTSHIAFDRVSSTVTSCPVVISCHNQDIVIDNSLETGTHHPEGIPPVTLL